MDANLPETINNLYAVIDLLIVRLIQLGMTLVGAHTILRHMITTHRR
jgi:hypothetical protein